MRRRDFIEAIAGAAAGWPLIARAQQTPMPVIGWLSSGSRDADDALRLPPFRLGLNEVGYVEGRNVAIEYRQVADQVERLPAFASDLADRKVSLIVAAGRPDVALAAKSVTTSIPIVFSNAADPVQLGLVASLNRPGGNITGTTTDTTELETKRLGLLRELVPSATSIAVLVNPTRPGVDALLTQAQQTAGAIGLTLHILKASSDRDFDEVFATLVQVRPGALIITVDGLFNDQIDQLAALARRYSVPATFGFREFAAAGGLMSYGPALGEAYRQAGILAGRRPRKCLVSPCRHRCSRVPTR